MNGAFEAIREGGFTDNKQLYQAVLALRNRYVPWMEVKKDERRSGFAADCKFMLSGMWQGDSTVRPSGRAVLATCRYMLVPGRYFELRFHEFNVLNNRVRQIRVP